MDRTLNEYINRAKIINENNIKNNISAHDCTKLKNELKHMLFNIEKTFLIVRNTLESINTISIKQMEVAPKEYNYSNKQTMIKNNVKHLKYAKPIYQNNITNYIMNDIYWCEEINQYYLKINNLVLYGNISNIYTKQMVKNNNNIHQLTPCVYKNNCDKVLSNTYCKFWHDPKDLIILKNNRIITDDYYFKTIQLTRNFTNTSWLYTNTVMNNTPQNMRYIGNGATLNNDIALCRISNTYKEQIENFKAQVMHDLLILLKLTEVISG